MLLQPMRGLPPRAMPCIPLRVRGCYAPGETRGERTWQKADVKPRSPSRSSRRPSRPLLRQREQRHRRRDPRSSGPASRFGRDRTICAALDPPGFPAASGLSRLMAHGPERGRRRPASIMLSATIWLAGTLASLAHDWYPPWCCSDDDCRALAEDRGETVVEEANGWRLWDGRLIRPENSRPSPDQKYHLCEEPTTKAIICFFVPPRPS